MDEFGNFDDSWAEMNFWLAMGKSNLNTGKYRTFSQYVFWQGNGKLVLRSVF